MKKIEEDRGNEKVIRVELDPKEMYEYDILGEVKDAIHDENIRFGGDFFHVTVKDDEMSMEIQGYNTSSFRTLIFDISKFRDEEKEKAIICLYRAVQWRTKIREGSDHLMYVDCRKGKNKF